MQGHAGEGASADSEVLVAEILAILKLGPRGGDFSAAHQLTITLAQQHSEAIAELTAGCLRQDIDGGVILDAALSFLPMTRWAELVALAVDAVGHDSDSEAAQSVLDYAGLQHPAAVHPFLTHLFAAGYFAGYRDTTVFREAPLEAVLFLFGALWSGNPWATRLVAAALLETRLPEALAFVQHVLPEELALLLPSVGFEVAGTQFRQLYPDCVLHLAFATTYLPRRRELAPHDWGRIHPTWAWEREVEKPHRVGGTGTGTCSWCGGTLHHLITLDPMPAGLGVTGLSRLELATCLSCLGWEHAPLAYRHDATGRPADVSGGDGRTAPQFPVGPVGEGRVGLVDLGPRWRWQEWGLANGRENLSRVGGHPAWVQDAEYPACPRCRRTMPFLMQLDSELPDARDIEWLWGSGGLCYAFWCDGCKVSNFLWQCT